MRNKLPAWALLYAPIWALACVVVFVLLTSSLPALSAAERPSEAVGISPTGYYALIIGNNDYRNVRKLTTAIADANAVAKALKEGFGFETTLLLNATRSEIITAINTFKNRLKTDDHFLIYYAGHGEFDKSAGKAYWLPVDAESDNPVNWIISDDITAYLKRIVARHVLIVADSCYSGDFTRDVSIDLAGKSDKEAVIERMLKKPSRTLMASGGNEPVLDTGGGRHSVFADSFLKALAEVEERRVTATDLFRQGVQNRVIGRAKQTPIYKGIRDSGDEDGDFVFRLAKVPDKEPDRRTPTKLPELQLNKPQQSGFSLAEYEKQAQTLEANKADWSAALQKMKGAYNDLLAFQRRDVTPDLKTAAWSNFLNSFKEKNPYTNEDDELRQKARQELERWRTEQIKAEEQQKIAQGQRPDPITGMEFAFVKGGCFDMGDTFSEGEADEKPVHNVCVSDFYLGKYEVTVGQFRAFVQDANYRTEAEKGDGCRAWSGSEWKTDKSKSWRSPGFTQDDSQPVVCVSWNDAKAFGEWLTRKSGKTYRLPREAEWEYAAREGGRKVRFGTGTDRLNADIANFDARAEYKDPYSDAGKYRGKTLPVGSFRPNILGLYDMAGNVWEWVWDWYGDYPAGNVTDPQGPATGSGRVSRGGSWGDDARHCRSASRYFSDPGGRSYYLGFRLLRTR